MKGYDHGGPTRAPADPPPGRVPAGEPRCRARRRRRRKKTILASCWRNVRGQGVAGGFAPARRASGRRRVPVRLAAAGGPMCPHGHFPGAQPPCRRALEGSRTGSAATKTSVEARLRKEGVPQRQGEAGAPGGSPVAEQREGAQAALGIEGPSTSGDFRRRVARRPASAFAGGAAATLSVVDVPGFHRAAASPRPSPACPSWRVAQVGMVREAPRRVHRRVRPAEAPGDYARSAERRAASQGRGGSVGARMTMAASEGRRSRGARVRGKRNARPGRAAISGDGVYRQRARRAGRRRARRPPHGRDARAQVLLETTQDHAPTAGRAGEDVRRRRRRSCSIRRISAGRRISALASRGFVEDGDRA